MDDMINRTEAIEIVNFECGEWRGLARTIGNEIRKLPSALSDNRLERIADIVEGTIDHLDRDDALDMLYQIKEVLK